jgi:hypothetical protein
MKTTSLLALLIGSVQFNCCSQEFKTPPTSTGSITNNTSVSTKTNAATKQEKHELDGVVVRVDADKKIIVIAPWNKDKVGTPEYCDRIHTQEFTLVTNTAVEGLTSATVGEIETGTKNVKSAELGVVNGGPGVVKFEVDNMTQLVERKVTVHWDKDTRLTRIELVAMMPGESF